MDHQPAKIMADRRNSGEGVQHDAGRRPLPDIAPCRDLNH